MIQRQRLEVTEFLKIGESLISALQLIYMSQISPKSNDRVISTLFKVQEEDFNQ